MGARAVSLAALCAALPAQGFLGVGDTSFVTVIADPAEAANWAAELGNLVNQLSAARGSLQTLVELRTFAGDPLAAVAALRDLSEITSAIGGLSSGAQTEADLIRAWQAMGEAQRLGNAEALLQSAGSGGTMEVFGQPEQRDARRYSRLAQEVESSLQIRGQVTDEQAARVSVAAELAMAWSQFKAATTESSKQAILSEISQLQSQNQLMDTRRRALLDDLSLADRQDKDDAAVRSGAADEQLLAESALLNASVEGRVQSAESGRLATLQKTAPAPPAPDYAGLKLWTTADAGGTSN